MKHLFAASIIVAFFVLLFLLSEHARKLNMSIQFVAAAFVLFIAFVLYHVIIELIADYKLLHKFKNK